MVLDRIDNEDDVLYTAISLFISFLQSLFLLLIKIIFFPCAFPPLCIILILIRKSRLSKGIELLFYASEVVIEKYIILILFYNKSSKKISISIFLIVVID